MSTLVGHPVLDRLRPQVRQALVAYLTRIAQAYPDLVVSVTLYGSQARGESQAESDIDLLLLIRRDSIGLRQALSDLAWAVQFEYGVVISDIIRNLDQWEQMRRERFPFYQNIEREGLVLWKSTSDLMLSYV
jgi:predicted nucleotidyltransferase